MLISQQLISKIKDFFSLNVYETKVWLALLGKGIASAGEIAEISRVPRSRTYDVLESLEKKGFSIVKLGKPVKYIGVKPRIVLEKLKNNLKKDSEERIITLSNIKDTNEFTQLEEIYKGGIAPVKREDISAALRGKANITNHLREILRNASKEVIICTNANEMNSKFKLFSQTFSTLLNAGVKIKIALSGNTELIKELSKRLGVKIKQIDVDSKFFIIDKREILFYLSKELEQDNAIWLNSEFFISAFAALFEKAINGGK